MLERARPRYRSPLKVGMTTESWIAVKVALVSGEARLVLTNDQSAGTDSAAPPACDERIDDRESNQHRADY